MDVNMFREEHVPSAGWVADDHGDVRVLCSRRVRKLQVSDEHPPVRRMRTLMYVQSARFTTHATFER
jgi:hypothetical protein